VGFGITGSDGSYKIAGLAPATYTLEVEKPGYDAVSGTASPTYDLSGNPVAASSSFSLVLTDVPSQSITPSGYALEQNYPNPFNPTTQIVYSVPAEGHVSIEIYNLIGQRVVTVVDRDASAGTYSVTWNGRDAAGHLMPSGVYLYRISAGKFTATRKMVLMK
jgi:hypothetical protein